MEVSFQVYKIIKLVIYNAVTSDGGADEVLVWLQLIEKKFKDVNSMYILFSVKHPQTFREL